MVRYSLLALAILSFLTTLPARADEADGWEGLAVKKRVLGTFSGGKLSVWTGTGTYDERAELHWPDGEQALLMDEVKLTIKSIKLKGDVVTLTTQTWDERSANVTTCETTYVWNSAQRSFDEGEEKCIELWQQLQNNFESALKKKDLKGAVRAARKLFEFHTEEYDPSMYALSIDEIALEIAKVFVPVAVGLEKSGKNKEAESVLKEAVFGAWGGDLSGSPSDALKRIQIAFPCEPEVARSQERDYDSKKGEKCWWNFPSTPQSAQILNDASFVYQRLGRHENALAILTALLPKVPSRAVAYLNLADSLVALNKSDAADLAYVQYSLQLAQQKRDVKLPADIAKKATEAKARLESAHKCAAPDQKLQLVLSASRYGGLEIYCAHEKGLKEGAYEWRSPVGEILSRGKFEGGVKVGEWQEFYEREEKVAAEPELYLIAAKKTYVKKDGESVLEGPFEERHSDGRWIAKGQFLRERKSGLWKEWTFDGLIRSGSYRDGEKNGTWFLVDDSGFVHRTTEYVYGKKTGVDLVTVEGNGEQVLSTYQNDVLEGPHKIWNVEKSEKEGEPALKRLRVDGQYSGGKKQGRWRSYYYDKGVLHCEGEYKDGRRIGKWIVRPYEAPSTKQVVDFDLDPKAEDPHCGM